MSGMSNVSDMGDNTDSAGPEAGSDADRPVYRHEQLRRVLAPASIAIVGASPRAGAFGERTLANLGGYPGRVYLVNARYPEINGQKCYPSVKDLPESPDCVVVTTGRETIEGIIRDCAAARAGGMVIYASGFAELGTPERIAEQEQLAALARSHDVRIIGPNCVGIINFRLAMGLTFTGGVHTTPPGPNAIGVASQSGAMGNAIAQGGRIGFDFSHMLTTGNSCDVDVADYVSYLAEDADCRAIVCVFEGLRAPQRLAEAGRIARAAGKPLIVHKIATGASGARVAVSHTGTIAGSAEAWKALFHRMGAIVVDDFEALAETASFFAKAPAPRARAAGVVSMSGGFCVIHADAAEKHGVALPAPTGTVREALLANLPDFAAPANPCDVTGAAVNNPRALENCCEAFLASPDYDTVVLTHNFASEVLKPRVLDTAPLAERHGKIACSTWASGWLEGPGAHEAARSPHIALFRSVDRCFRTLALWFRHGATDGNKPQDHAADLLANRVSAAAQRAAATILDAAGPGLLPATVGFTLLEEYGIPAVPIRLARSADEACRIADDLGYPVALKIESPDIAHKTEAGGVLLHLADAAAVRAAFATILDNAATHAPAARIDGVTVQAMARPGLELLAGARVDPVFGPVVVLALGGILVETLRDRVLDFAPLGLAAAHAMIDRLEHQQLLAGWRGATPVDRDSLANTLSRLSQLIADHPRIAEIEINPLICMDGQPVAVDVLVSAPGFGPAAH